MGYKASVQIGIIQNLLKEGKKISHRSDSHTRIELLFRFQRRARFFQRTRRLESLNLWLAFHVVSFVFFQAFLQSLDIARWHNLLRTVTLCRLLHRFQYQKSKPPCLIPDKSEEKAQIQRLKILFGYYLIPPSFLRK